MDKKRKSDLLLSSDPVYLKKLKEEKNVQVASFIARPSGRLEESSIVTPTSFCQSDEEPHPKPRLFQANDSGGYVGMTTGIGSKPRSVSSKSGAALEPYLNDEDTHGIPLDQLGNDTARVQLPNDASTLLFRVIRNDNTPLHMKWLVDLKNIFSAQLPKMPREYISRLVFDWNHRAIIALKNNRIIGGISFRPFPDEGFIEIAFLAITANEQQHGYGSFVMSHLKEAARIEGILYFLTYADNNAVGYFKKQGFTKEVSLEPHRWKRIIKDYEGGTLMECRLHPDLCYLRCIQMIEMQRAALKEQLRKVIDLDRKHVLPPNAKFPLKLSEIPGVKDLPPAQVDVKLPDARGRAELRGRLMEKLKTLYFFKDSWPFHVPVSAEDVQDYYEVITDPIDIKTMMGRLERADFYLNDMMFSADLLRMCKNCQIFNGPDSIFFQCAKSCERFIRGKLFPELLNNNVMIEGEIECFTEGDQPISEVLFVK